MATGTEIVTRAYREGNLIGATASLTTAQLNEGLTELNDYIDTLYGFELGEFAFDWPIAPQNNAPVNERFPLFPRDERLIARVYPYPPSNVNIILFIDGAGQNIYFPQNPSDGARVHFINLASPENAVTIFGNGRLITGVASFSALPSELSGRRYFYRADLATWVLVEEVTATAQIATFAPVYDPLLVLGTLERLSPRFGRELTATQFERIRRLLMRLKAQYKQDTPEAVDGDNVLLVPYADQFRSRFYDGTELLS